MEELFLVSIQEDVIFPEGEEVDELMSISLDPQVEQLESALNGSIEVTGEYSIVTDEEDNIRQFFRHIPVQVFLPSHQHLTEDSDIQIHSFDYDVEKPGRLSLTAELAFAVSTTQLKEVDEADELDAVDTVVYEQQDSYEEETVELELDETESEEEQEEEQEDNEEEAAVQVQKRTEEEEASIFGWLDERPQNQAQWRFSITSGNVELISTQDGEQPPKE